jgi:hypothetical protein
MPFDNPLLAKLFEGILEGRGVDFRNDLLPREEVEDAINLQPIPLSRRQREAVFRAWTHEISYIQGPPGTGKSHTITAIMLAGLFLKKRVLLVSHKKPAIDVVFEKLAKDSPGRTAILGPGNVIYATNESSQRQRMRGELQQWLARCGSLDSWAELEELRRKLAQSRVLVAQLRSEVGQLEAQIKRALESERDYHRSQETLDRNRRDYLKQFGNDKQRNLKLSPGADVARALGVLGHIEHMLVENVQTTGGSAPLRTLLQIQRFFAACVKRFSADPLRLPRNLTAVNYLREHLDLTRDYQVASHSRSRVVPDYLAQARKTLRRKRDDLAKERGELARAQLAAHIVGRLHEDEEDVQKFRSMIHNANPSIIAQKMKGIDFKEVIGTFPLWVGQMRHLGEFLPFEPELFDLVVVDEASQVNIAEIIPAFYRGSRICVVGDDKQLGLNAAGVNFGFGAEFEEIIWSRHFAASGVLYLQGEQRSLLVRKHSILDFISSLGDGRVPKTTLDEHFRSFPQLASFTSEQFYNDDGGLRLMKEVPKNLEMECFNCIEVGGERDPDVKVVQNEVDELMKWLKRLIRERHYEREPAFRSHGFRNENPPTLGVISILREQRDVILEAVESEFSPSELSTHNLLIGTPEEFQGNERDIIFITLGLTGLETRVNHWEEKRRFNVATSRAIHYCLLIYGGIPANARLIKSYLTHFGKSWRMRDHAVPEGDEEKCAVERYRWDWNRPLHRELCESEFEHRVADCLEQFVTENGGPKRIRLFNQVLASRSLGVSSCGQKRLDFVVLNAVSGVCVAVEVDGRDHFSDDGRSYSETHLERVEILRRAGWEIVHIPYYRWWKDGWLSDRNEVEFNATVTQLFMELKNCLRLP